MDRVGKDDGWDLGALGGRGLQEGRVGKGVLGRGAPGVTATCGRSCLGASGVLSLPVWSLFSGTPLPMEAAGWDGGAHWGTGLPSWRQAGA